MSSFRRAFHPLIPAGQFIGALALAAFFSGQAGAQCVSLTAPGSAYTQNFDTLSNVAGSTTNTLTIPGWFMTETLGGARDNEQYAVDTGGSTTGDTYSYGAAGSTDRALGGLRSGTLAPNFGACFTNNTGTTVTSLAIAYTGEEWRLGAAARTDQINFEYSTNATNLTTGTWVGVSALNFVTPDTATAGAKNGNAAADRTALSSTISGLTIPNGATFWIRWTDIDVSGSDDGLAVDDFSLTPSAGSTNPTGTGSASPNPVTAGSSTTLTANITPGPASTGIQVTCDLGTIGANNTFSLPNSGGNTYSAAYSVPGGTAVNNYTLPCTVTDAQGGSGTFNISLQVTSSAPTGTGSANPNSLQAGASTLLTVSVLPGTNPLSTGITVTGDLTAIGGALSQPFFDDGTHGDVTPNDNIFSFNATVLSGTAPGAKSLPVSIADAQARTGGTTIALTIQSPPVTTIKISQVFGGGGNSGATYLNDFIELFNQSTIPVDVSTWSVQKASATQANWESTNLCPNGGTCVIQPGHYYLVQEASGGNANSVANPAPDITGIIAMGAGSGKIALVANTTLLTASCPTGTPIVDFVGYGGAGSGGPNCSEGTPAGTASNTAAAIRKNNGCIDTDNNANDFSISGPTPRNSSSPVNYCGGDPTRISGVGSASPASVDPAGALLLTVAVTPATSPASAGITVTGNLTSISGSASQPFYDDGSHGDLTAGDNIFSFRTNVPVNAAFGARSIPTTITDNSPRSEGAPITITVQSPTCGVERWAVKTGTDPQAGSVDQLNPIRTTIKALRALTAPVLNPNPPYDPRFSPTETSVFVINGILTTYKLEDDVDYHIVIQDPNSNTIITEIPSPACDGSSGPFDAAVASVRAKFDSRFSADEFFKSASVPVQVKGVGFFDFIHGQTGVAPNGIELHPLLDMTFTTTATVTLSSSASPSTFGQPVTLTATVPSAGGTATGDVSFFEGPDLLGTGTLNGSGQATFTTSALSAGAHTLTAYYDGDANIAQSTSAAFTQNVNQATPVITWSNPADITYGSALGATQLNASAPSPGTFVYTPASGTVLSAGNGQTLSVVFTPTSSNYAAAAKNVLINVLPASGGGTPASLVVTRTLTHVGGQVVATLTIANNGGTAAQNVTLTSVKIATTSGTPLPQSLGIIAAGASVQAVVNIPGAVGAPGAANTLTVSGTYTGGTFGSSARIILP